MMEKKKLVLKVKKLAKKLIVYQIVDDCKVYTLKHTHLKIQFSLKKKYEKKWASIPVENNKIVFSNYMGSGYGCNSKYVTEELLKDSGRYHIVWVVRDAEKNRDKFPSGAEVVEYLSEEAFQAYASAKIWVSNYHLVAYLNQGLQKKQEQFYIQLWHGSFGIKKIEGDCKVLTKDKNWLYLARKNSAITDYWISNSQFETAVFRQAFWNVRSVLEYGHPRNDLFFRESEGLTKMVKKNLGISPSIKTALFVPTFRDEIGEGAEKTEMLDADLLLDALKQRFDGDWKILVRRHPRMIKDNQKLRLLCRDTGRVVDVTDYPDIQELLVIADAVVTDYSSCIFDFLLTGKPGFFFVPDAKDYDDMRGMYYPLTAAPFPVAGSNQEMSENIRNFDMEEYHKKSEIFLEGKGSVEDGRASARVKKLIDEILDGKSLR